MKFKQKKVKKYRGSKTHGCGSMKKRRGAGNRGGRGRAGSGKKGDAKKPSYWKEKAPKGFTSKNRMNIRAINLQTIQQNLLNWTNNKMITKGTDNYEINLKKLGYDKLLGTGIIKEKLIITTGFASNKAIEKVSANGGKVELLVKEKTVAKETTKTSEKVQKKKEDVSEAKNQV